MSKQLALATVEPTWMAKSVTKLREYHGIAMNAANQTVAAAIFAGLEVRAIKKHLADSHSESLDSWFDRNQDTVGFSRATGWRYLKLAEGIKAKLKDKAPELDRILSFAPSRMSPAQVKTLLQALHKSVDGDSLNDLYLDYGIVKPQRRKPHNPDPTNNGAGDSSDDHTTVEEKVQFQLDLFGQFALELEKEIDDGGRKVLLVSKWPKPRLKEAIAITKRNLKILQALEDAS